MSDRPTSAPLTSADEAVACLIGRRLAQHDIDAETALELLQTWVRQS